MSNYFNKVTVIELEMTCWEDKVYQEEYSENIEIGCALLDITDGKILDSRSIYVTPEYMEVHEKMEPKNKYPKELRMKKELKKSFLFLLWCLWVVQFYPFYN